MSETHRDLAALETTIAAPVQPRSEVEPLVLWGRITSLQVQKLVWTLDEVGRSYRRIDAGRQWGVVDTPEYRRLNPNGRVPTIEDGQFVLWESNVIVRYLCARYGWDPLYPSDIEQRMDAERWMDWTATEFLPAVRPAVNVFARGLTDWAPPDSAKAALERATELSAVLDQRLSASPYLAGEAFTMADIAAGAIAHWWVELAQNLPGQESIMRWYKLLRARPAFSALAPPYSPVTID